MSKLKLDIQIITNKYSLNLFDTAIGLLTQCMLVSIQFINEIYNYY